MLTLHKNNDLQKISLTYLPAQYHNKTCMVDYYLCDPITGKKVRKQIKLTRVKNRTTPREFQRYVTDLVYNINNRLASGWNPLTENSNVKHYESFVAAIDVFIAEKTKELRKDTIRSYKSCATMLCKFVLSKHPNLRAGAFTAPVAVDFMEYVYSTKNITARTYNNYLKTSRAICQWMVDHYYMPINPFEKIKLKRAEPKKRGILSSETRRKLCEYLSVESPMFLLVCYLVYYSLIRPKEIRCLRVQDIRLSDKYIVIRSDVAKNHKERYAAITPEIVKLILELKILTYPPTFYVVGENFKTSEKATYDTYFTKYFISLRKKLRLPDDAQLYGLRDTAIYENLKAGVDPLTIKQHADHHSLKMTDIYSKHADPNLVEKMYQQPIKF